MKSTIAVIAFVALSSLIAAKVGDAAPAPAPAPVPVPAPSVAAGRKLQAVAALEPKIAGSGLPGRKLSQTDEEDMEDYDYDYDYEGPTPAPAPAPTAKVGRKLLAPVPAPAPSPMMAPKSSMYGGY